MLMTITNTLAPAGDLGYLLHKHPDKVQTFGLSFGTANVFYTEKSPERCTAALLLDINPIALLKNSRKNSTADFSLGQYVNDRPYASSSFLSTAIAQVFGSALNARCNTRPELVDAPLPLLVEIPVLPARGGEAVLRRLFEPLGYQVQTEQLPLDDAFPEWGESRYYSVRLSHTLPLHQLLSHIYVLTPVLDNDKHYWVGAAEIDKLLRHGEGWLAEHPERQFIARRYLRHQKSLTRQLLARLAEEDDPDPDATEARRDKSEMNAEKSLGLNEQRLLAVTAALEQSRAERVLDLGCGEGKLLRLLAHSRQFTEIVGLDVSYRHLEYAAARLNRLPERIRNRITLLHGSLTYRDERLRGFDAAAVVEVVEHLDPERLAAFERLLFGDARPGTVIITTPNREYNVRWPSLAAGTFRHADHRFEWTRSEFREWAGTVAERHGYRVDFRGIGPDDPEVGSPTQMGVFNRN